ncbi:MAG: precorrin-3B C(17)-methyltransferase [Lachnospiraceae bacterium]|nr:precorrin-3B C(17)-methyltransferase [Lachnospiraceae bacterium]
MGKLYVIGIGPGEEAGLTLKARKALKECELICGYGVYIELVKAFLSEETDKKLPEFYVTSMKQETERVKYACEQAAQDGRKTVCLVCSGDAGVYGLAGLVLEYLYGSEAEDTGTTAETDSDNGIKVKTSERLQLEIVPGVTAALSGAAVLGAPLMNDFCVISLSDLMTPWEVIEKRLRAAAQGDFPICIYNPMSNHRPEHLKRACELLLKEKPAETVCGYVQNIGRDGESFGILPLSELKDAKLDMFTTVFIGSSQTVTIGGRMVTRRGYELENGSQHRK